MRLPRAFYEDSTLSLAPRLLGTILCRRSGATLLRGRIVEVEAYLPHDPASHSFRGKTPRNSIMFGPPGFLYVYFTYGMHFCANVVTEAEGTGAAILLRAVEPLEGMSLMRRRRGGKEITDSLLCSGPARLCQAFGIGREENGTDLCSGGIWIEDDGTIIPKADIATSSRIGIRLGKEQLWRFTIRGSPYLSRSQRQDISR